jgi:hypothetical protein
MRTLFVIPKMFTSRELANVDEKLPEDFETKSKEFWDYVDVRLSVLRSVQKLYYDSLSKDDSEEALDLIKKNNENCYAIIQKFREAGARLQATEDPLLIEETVSWISMMKDNNEEDLATEDLLAKNMKERDAYITSRISQTLKEGEIGILFLAPGRQATDQLPSDVRVIKMQPFDPTDYVNSWLVSKALKDEQKSPS